MDFPANLCERLKKKKELNGKTEQKQQTFICVEFPLQFLIGHDSMFVIWR